MSRSSSVSFHHWAVVTAEFRNIGLHRVRYKVTHDGSEPDVHCNGDLLVTSVRIHRVMGLTCGVRKGVHVLKTVPRYHAHTTPVGLS